MLDTHMHYTHKASMTFKEWLKSTGVKQADAAKALGLTQSQVSRIANDGTTSLETAIKVREYTNGEVSVDELRPEPA